jgi:HK97 family phage portal protein
MWNPFRRKEKALTPPARGNGGWWPIVSESYPGAWQQNVEVDQDTVLAYHAVFSCISLIAADIAKMPIEHQKKDSLGIWKETDSGELARLLKKPNTFQTRIQFVESWITSRLAHGNTYVIKLRNTRGGVEQLRILDPLKVTPLVSDSGEVFYQIAPDNIGGVEEQVIVPAREMIHDRTNCLFHPLVGLSPIFACGISAMQGFHIQNNSASFFKNGGKPSGVIIVPGSLSEEKAAEIKSGWETGYSGRNAGKTAILSGGADYKGIAMTAVDAQTVEQLKMTAEIVCSVFHVPAYKIGMAALPANSNVEALEQQYYSQCLQTPIESIELLLQESFDLPSDQGVEFDTDVLLRMDTERRYKTYSAAVSSAILSPNEARAKENMPPVTGGESPYLQQQNYSLAALARRDLMEAAAQPEPAQPQESEPESKALTDSEAWALKSMVKGMLSK